MEHKKRLPGEPHPYLLSQEKKDLDALIETVTSKKFKPKEVSEMTGLTYRQFNSWDNDHEIINTERKSEGGWRSFSSSEVLTLLICTELQKKFGISFEKMKWVKGRLKQEEWISLKLAIAGIRSYGADPHILTDLENCLFVLPKSAILFILKENELGEAPLEFSDFILLRITPLIYKIVTNIFDGKCPLEPDPIKTKLQRELVSRLESLRFLKPHEKALILEMQKNGTKRIEIKLTNGKICDFTFEEEIARDTEKTFDDIKDALEAGDFQSVQVTKRDGKIARITRRHSIKIVE